MAIRHELVVTDDLDGSPLDPDNHRETRFSINGKAYTIDLSDENQDRFLEVLEPYIDNARNDRTTKRHKSRSTNQQSSRLRTAHIRQWAADNGYAVSDRGRISREVMDAYNAAS